MKSLQFLILAVVVLLFTGCVTDSPTTPLSHSNRVEAPTSITPAAAKPQIGFQELPLRSGYVRLHLYRIGKFTGSAVLPQILIDGVELGRLSGGKYLSVYLHPGTHVIETKIPWINYPIKGGANSITIPENSETYLEYTVDVAITGASQHHVSARYSNGFTAIDPNAAKSVIATLAPLPIAPDILIIGRKN